MPSVVGVLSVARVELSFSVMVTPAVYPPRMHYFLNVNLSNGSRDETGPRNESSVSTVCNAWFIRDKKNGIKKINSGTSSLAFLCHTSQMKEGIRNSKNQGWSTRWYRFFTYPALKHGTGTYPAVKNGSLRKIVSRVGHIKDICTPPMHNVVQNYKSSSIPHKSEMTIIFFSKEKFQPSPNLVKDNQ